MQRPKKDDGPTHTCVRAFVYECVAMDSMNALNQLDCSTSGKPDFSKLE